MAWREDNRRVANGTHLKLVTGTALWLPKRDLVQVLGKGGSVTEAKRSQIVAGLIAKQAELAGVIVELQRQIDQHRADLSHIDGVLRILATDLDPETIRPKRPYRRTLYFERRELSRLTLAGLRTAAEPLTPMFSPSGHWRRRVST
jgi:hypothetical protein